MGPAPSLPSGPGRKRSRLGIRSLGHARTRAPGNRAVAQRPFLAPLAARSAGKRLLGVRGAVRRGARAVRLGFRAERSRICRAPRGQLDVLAPAHRAAAVGQVSHADARHRLDRLVGSRAEDPGVRGWAVPGRCRDRGRRDPVRPLAPGARPRGPHPGRRPGRDHRAARPSARARSWTCRPDPRDQMAQPGTLHDPALGAPSEGWAIHELVVFP